MILEDYFTTNKSVSSTPIYFCTQKSNDYFSTAPALVNRIYSGFTGRDKNSTHLCYDKDGKLDFVIVSLIASVFTDSFPNLLDTRFITDNLPAGSYNFANVVYGDYLCHLSKLWLRGQYRFLNYSKSPEKICCLVCKDTSFLSFMSSENYAKDLINMPANDLNPDTFTDNIFNFAQSYGATYHCYAGDDLLLANFPLIHAVGSASQYAPRLVEFSWGKKESSSCSIVLIGKGVTFDTGGLNLKPGNSMRHMKKDMSGAAHILGLSRLIMSNKLDLHLRVILPIVENCVSGSSFRPGDVYSSRSGSSIEIGNTDAEGRLILADSISYATESNPDLIIVMASLTGGARVAVGPLIVPYYSNNEVMNKLFESSFAPSETFLRFPLYSGYNSYLKSNIADLCHISRLPFADSIMAALFLSHFAAGSSFFHFDIYGWDYEYNEAKIQGLESLFKLLRKLSKKGIK